MLLETSGVIWGIWGRFGVSLVILECRITECYKKMAIILPTGQWYAPSAVIIDAWYCMVLHCIA